MRKRDSINFYKYLIVNEIKIIFLAWILVWIDEEPIKTKFVPLPLTKNSESNSELNIVN